MIDVLSIGEALIDLTQTGLRADGIPQYAANPGGAPANVAVAACRLGARAAFVGRVGADAFGAQLQTALAKEEIDISGLSTDDTAPTTLAVVSVSADGERSFRFYRSPGADLCLCRTHISDALLQTCRFLHFGSLSLTDEPSRSAVLDAVTFAASNGAYISYDPNYRAPLWPDRDTAKQWMLHGCGFADLVKVSGEEAILLTGAADIPSAGKCIADLGPKLVLITLGAEGVWYHCRQGSGHVSGYSVPVVDTNGAGDTFMGAVLRALSMEEKTPDCLEIEALERILRYANAAAALAVTRAGAIPAIPTAEAVADFLSAH